MQVCMIASSYALFSIYIMFGMDIESLSIYKYKPLDLCIYKKYESMKQIGHVKQFEK